MSDRYNVYDNFAYIYNLYWGDDFTGRFYPLLQQLLLKDLSPGAALLDVACGTGQLARRLQGDGYQVVGLDGSAEMLRYAQQNAPQVEFLLEDARTFQLPPRFHAAICAYDSLNHILKLTELEAAFRNIHAALLPGGRFIFDMNMDSGFHLRWRGSFGEAKDDHAFLVRSRYNREDKLASMLFTVFMKAENGWQRTDVTLIQIAHPLSDIMAALKQAGFVSALPYHQTGEGLVLGEGERTFFVAEKGQA